MLGGRTRGCGAAWAVQKGLRGVPNLVPLRNGGHETRAGLCSCKEGVVLWVAELRLSDHRLRFYLPLQH